MLRFNNQMTFSQLYSPFNLTLASNLVWGGGLHYLYGELIPTLAWCLTLWKFLIQTGDLDYFNLTKTIVIQDEILMQNQLGLKNNNIS